MDEAVEELVDTVGEFLRRHDGRPLSQAERATIGRLLDRLDEVRLRLAFALAATEAEGVRVALAGRAPLPVGRVH